MGKGSQNPTAPDKKYRRARFQTRWGLGESGLKTRSDRVGVLLVSLGLNLWNGASMSL